MAVNKPPAPHHHTAAYAAIEKAARKEAAENAMQPELRDPKKKPAAKEPVHDTLHAPAPSATPRPDKFTAPPKTAGLQTLPTHEPVGRPAGDSGKALANDPSRGRPAPARPDRAGASSASTGTGAVGAAGSAAPQSPGRPAGATASPGKLSPSTLAGLTPSAASGSAATPGAARPSVGNQPSLTATKPKTNPVAKPVGAPGSKGTPAATGVATKGPPAGPVTPTAARPPVGNQPSVAAAKPKTTAVAKPNGTPASAAPAGKKPSQTQPLPAGAQPIQRDPLVVPGSAPNLSSGVDPNSVAGLSPDASAAADTGGAAGLSPDASAAADMGGDAGLSPDASAAADMGGAAGLSPDASAAADMGGAAGLSPDASAVADTGHAASLYPDPSAAADAGNVAGLAPDASAAVDAGNVAGLAPDTVTGLNPGGSNVADLSNVTGVLSDASTVADVGTAAGLAPRRSTVPDLGSVSGAISDSSPDLTPAGVAGLAPEPAAVAGPGADSVPPYSAGADSGEPAGGHVGSSAGLDPAGASPAAPTLKTFGSAASVSVAAPKKPVSSTSRPAAAASKGASADLQSQASAATEHVKSWVQLKAEKLAAQAKGAVPSNAHRHPTAPAPAPATAKAKAKATGNHVEAFTKTRSTAAVQGLSTASSPLGDLSKVRLQSQGSQLISSGHKAYSYAPSVMRDRSGTYKMWFGGLAPSGSGDAIFYSESKSPSSGWSKPKAVFTAAPGHFDGLDVCDPSVVRDAKGTFYMYYGAAKADNVGSSAGGKAWTSIGLATSTDGVNWSRAKSPSGGDLKVVPPAHPDKGTYGAGQPSVVYKNGYFQMLYTDTSVTGNNNVYLIRSTSPRFDAKVESFDASSGSWHANVPASSRKPLVPGSADTEWAMVGDKFVTAVRSGGALTLSTFNSSGPPQLQRTNVPGVKTSGNVAFIRTESGGLALRDGNKWDVMATVSDPSKVKNGPVDSPYTWSLRNLGFGSGA